VHVQEAKCQEKILRTPFSRLAQAFESGKHPELANFVTVDSDGLGHPLPKEVCVNLGLAVAYSNSVIPEYNKDVVTARATSSHERRRQLQKRRRAAKRFGLSASIPTTSTPPRLASHKNSTIHVVTGALVVRHWTGSWHYREQMEILNIMGLHKTHDFIRDRVDYLRTSNPAMIEKIEGWAKTFGKPALIGTKPENSRFLTPDLSL
jgi:hypothetical protein